MITHEATCWDISYLLRKMYFFHQKPDMTLGLNVRQNGLEINLPVSRAQSTFARAFSNELPAALGADAITSSTVTTYLCQRQFTSILVDPPRNRRRSLLIQQLLIPLSIIHSLLFGSWLASPAFQLVQSIDT
jgi:hypothetical protein